jgi:inner membrane protein
MPTFLTHPAVPLALAWAAGRGGVSGRLLAAGVVGSVAPDLDVLAFGLGIPYAAEFGHRGFSHSLTFAFLVAALGAGMARHLRAAPMRAFGYLFSAVASHGFLDAFTNGGFGIALLWPFSDQRFFAPVHPIEVAPLALSRLLSARGVTVLWSELLWVWLPALSVAAVVVLYRTRRGRKRDSRSGGCASVGNSKPGRCE